MRATWLLFFLIGCDAVPDLVFNAGDAATDGSTDSSSRPDVMNPCESDAAAAPNTVCCGSVPCVYQAGKQQECISRCPNPCLTKCYADGGIKQCCPLPPNTAVCVPIGETCP
jgi:hypothetical protein